MSTEINWQALYDGEHTDFCKVESRNYVLEQRIKALETALREIANSRGLRGKNGDVFLSIARKALGEE